MKGQDWNMKEKTATAKKGKNQQEKIAKNKMPMLAYRTFLAPLNTIEKFAGMDYDTLCLFPAHTVNSRGTPYCPYPPVWKWFDRLDFAPFDEMVHDFSKAMPDAKFICMIDMNSPTWLEHYNAFECSDTFNNLGRAIHNPFWQKATNDYFKEFLHRTHRKYGDRIQAYVLACGATDEWFDYSLGNEDSYRREAWRKWCLKNNLPDPVDIPSISAREHAPHGGFLRDPVQNKVAVDYWHFCNETIADTILHFASIAKSIVKDKAEIGCFYGYILEKTGFTLVSCGHLEYERVLASPDIDFLISPGTYTNQRNMGGGSGFLIPHGTASVYGKRLFHECDHRTHTYNPYLAPDITLRLCTAWPDEKSTVAGLKREAALALINRTHLWWFDMWGDYYQGEAVMKTIGKVRKIWDNHAAAPAKDVCEIAFIVDPESTYYLWQNHEDIPQVFRETRNKMNLIGAPFEIYSFNDIPKIKSLSQYKMIVFSSLFHLTEEKKKILRKYILKNKRTVLWLGLAGVMDNEIYDPANCRKLTGISDPDSNFAAIVKQNNWNSVWIPDYYKVTSAIMKQIAEHAGVHLYTRQEWPVFAEGNLLSIHTGTGGEETISIPRDSGTVTELFTGKTIRYENGKFTYRFKKPDTVLFELN